MIDVASVEHNKPPPHHWRSIPMRLTKCNSEFQLSVYTKRLLAKWHIQRQTGNYPAVIRMFFENPHYLTIILFIFWYPGNIFNKFLN